MLDRDYVPGIISTGTKHAKHDLGLDYHRDRGEITLEAPKPPNIIVRWNKDPRTAPLRQYFQEVYESLMELRDIARKVGIPRIPVTNKLPYSR
jgi:hypothetical protein